MFDQNLNEFYATITDSQERTLMHAFKNSHGNPDRASEIIKQLDPKLYSYYNQVFPAYYTKLNALTHETHHFYKDIVSLNILNNELMKEIMLCSFMKVFKKLNLVIIIKRFFNLNNL